MLRIEGRWAWASTGVAVWLASAGTAHAQPDPPAPKETASLERPGVEAATITFGAKPAPAPDPIIEGPPTPAREERPIAPAVNAPGPTEPAKTNPPPPPRSTYSIPWQLRSIGVSTGVRADTTFASYEDTGGRRGSTVASGLTLGFKIPGIGGQGTGLGLVGRVMMVEDTAPAASGDAGAPAAPGGGVAVVNPLVGAVAAAKLGRWLRGNAFLGFTAPIGAGGGDSPDKGLANARTKGNAARAGMDGALFAVNDRAIASGLGLAFVGHDLTVQIEATIIQMNRTRGEDVQPEASKTNFTSGLHAGYFFTRAVSFGSELRYQRWINAPFAVENDRTETSRDNLTVAGGPRLHLDVGGASVHPGVAYWRGLDKPLAASTPNYNGVQFDVPVVF